MTNIDQCRKLLSWYCLTSPHQLLLQFPNKQDWLPWEQYYENQTHTRCSISQGRNSGIEIAGFQVFFKTAIDISNVELYIYKNHTNNEISIILFQNHFLKKKIYLWEFLWGQNIFQQRLRPPARVYLDPGTAPKHVNTMMINGDDDEGDEGSDTVTVGPKQVELQ